jgi:phospholipid/cholesterol/gamma-HCH transport system substrate-binding protein
VNELAGTFVLLVLAGAVTAFVMTWKARGWFERTYELTLKCPPEGSLGLTEGSAVEILGIRVGAVERITVGDDGAIEAIARIKGPFFEKFVRTDSRAVVKKQFGLVGDAYVVIERGVKAPLPEEYRVLVAEKDTELLELAENLVGQVQNTLLPAIDEIRKAAAEYRQVGAELRDPEGRLGRFLDQLNEFAGRLQRGPGLVPRVLNDRELAEDAHAFVKGLNASLDELHGTIRELRQAAEEAKKVLQDTRGVVKDVKETTSKLPAVAESVRREARDLPGLVLQAQETLRQAEELVRGLQRHWLIRGYVEEPQRAAPIPPAAVTGDEAR